MFETRVVRANKCLSQQQARRHDSKHFLLDYPLYIKLRQQMIGVISNLCIPTLNVLLYGNQTLSFDINKQIFLAIQNYIIRSKRFQVNH